MKYGTENGEPSKHKKVLKQSRKLHKLEHREVIAKSDMQTNFTARAVANSHTSHHSRQQ